MKLRKTELWALALTAIFAASVASYRLGRGSGAAEVTVSRAVIETLAPALPSPGGDSAHAAPVDLNTAGVEELKSLDGIGDTLARRIVEDREANGPFASVEELTRVSGIGVKLLEANRDRLRVGESSG